MAKELEVTNMRSSKHDRLEVIEPEKPMFDNRDMCGCLCIICGALITYLLFMHGKISYENEIELAFTIIAYMALISLIMFWITQKIVRACYKRAKRKATGKTDD